MSERSGDTHQNNNLANAPKRIQLAVDLIQLLEENEIEIDTAIAALEIELKDCEQKQVAQAATDAEITGWFK